MVAIPPPNVCHGRICSGVLLFRLDAIVKTHGGIPVRALIADCSDRGECVVVLTLNMGRGLLRYRFFPTFPGGSSFIRSG